VTLTDGVKDLNDLGRRPDGRATFFRLVGDIERGGTESQEANEDVAEAPSA
jgi:hypothetical protein